MNVSLQRLSTSLILGDSPLMRYEPTRKSSFDLTFLNIQKSFSPFYRGYSSASLSIRNSAFRSCLSQQIVVTSLIFDTHAFFTRIDIQKDHTLEIRHCLFHKISSFSVKGGALYIESSSMGEKPVMLVNNGFDQCSSDDSEGAFSISVAWLSLVGNCGYMCSAPEKCMFGRINFNNNNQISHINQTNIHICSPPSTSGRDEVIHFESGRVQLTNFNMTECVVDADTSGPSFMACNDISIQFYQISSCSSRSNTIVASCGGYSVFKYGNFLNNTCYEKKTLLSCQFANVTLYHTCFMLNTINIFYIPWYTTLSFIECVFDKELLTTGSPLATANYSIEPSITLMKLMKYETSHCFDVPYKETPRVIVEYTLKIKRAAILSGTTLFLICTFVFAKRIYDNLTHSKQEKKRLDDEEVIYGNRVDDVEYEYDLSAYL